MVTAVMVPCIVAVVPVTVGITPATVAEPHSGLWPSQRNMNVTYRSVVYGVPATPAVQMAINTRRVALHVYGGAI